MTKESWKKEAEEMGFNLSDLLLCPICGVRSIAQSGSAESGVLMYDCLKGDHMFSFTEYFKLLKQKEELK